jgi:3-methylfumaryl-CoA hydratase
MTVVRPRESFYRQCRRRAGCGRGTLAFCSEIREGDWIDRRSTITAIEEKRGRTGPLCFVTVRHEVRTLRGIAIEESQSFTASTNALDRTANPTKSRGPRNLRPSRITFAKSQWIRLSSLDTPHSVQRTSDPLRRLLRRWDRTLFGRRGSWPQQATYLLNFAVTTAGRVPARFSFHSLASASGSRRFF